MTAVPAVFWVALSRMAIYGWPVGDSMASAISPALKSIIQSKTKLAEKIPPAAKIMLRGSHFAASSSSSVKWQILFALVRLVTGAMIPGSQSVMMQRSGTWSPSHTNQDCDRQSWPSVLVLPVVEDLRS
jgi:hypothetical protein